MATNETDKFIGERVREERILAGLSQTELGNAIGISFQQVQKYEKGANRVSASKLMLIADVLGVELLSFFPESASAKAPKRTASTAAIRDAAKLDLIAEPLRSHIHGLITSAAEESQPEAKKKRRGAA